jgi:hypothetical protein
LFIKDFYKDSVVKAIFLLLLTHPLFSEECKMTAGKGPAGRAAEQTGQKTGKGEDIPGERGNEATGQAGQEGESRESSYSKGGMCWAHSLEPICPAGIGPHKR